VDGKRVGARELKEKDVLGEHRHNVSDAAIGEVLDETKSFQISPGGTVLLVQSGAATPDSAMVEELAPHFSLVPHTGIAAQVCTQPGETIAQALRLDAARAKADTIMVVWGNLEVKQDDLPTEIVSWVPVVDFVVPDQYQKVRMHLKIALIDVRSGQWSLFTTERMEEETLTTRHAREHDAKWPMRPIKQRLYRAAVQKLLDGYVVAGN
jgi:hypothetical protein